MQERTRTAGDVAVLELSGRFDAYVAPRVAEWLERALEAGRTALVVNLAGVTFMDSTALGTLVQGMKRCRQRHGDLHLCGLQRPVRIVFELTRLDGVFRIFETEDEAVRAFGGRDAVPATDDPADSIRIDLPAPHKYLSVVGACIAEMLARVETLADSASVTYAVQLAAHEVCTNIVEHAYADQPGGRIDLTLTLAPQQRRLVVELADTGRSFDPARVPEPDLREGQTHGYGLFLVHRLVDEVSYNAQPGGNRWRLVKRF